MKQQISGRLMTILPFALLSACLFSLGFTVFASNPVAKFPERTGTVLISVRDGYSELPLAGATVVIPETGQSYLTDEQGRIPSIRVPIGSDSEYSRIFPKPWGEITILVYYTGYVDCALFHVNVWENQTRNGPVILLFPDTGDMEGQPFTMTEGPNNIWVTGLLDKFRPQDSR